jgi:hypothetical protein
MRTITQKISNAGIVFLLMTLLFTNGAVFANGYPHVRRYLVTVQNLSDGQPFSPAVAATHRNPLKVFQVGELASPELEAIAENGDQSGMVAFLDPLAQVTEVVDVGVPLTPSGTTFDIFTDAVSFEIEARPGDVFSMATMLICTNDGITGLDRIRLPQQGSKIFWLNGYDAGTENNTEESEDIVDPCSALGPLGLAGDPNMNENAAVDSSPHAPIQMHPNIQGNADLSVSEHGWSGALGKVTITRLLADGNEFQASTRGAGEVPPVDTDATGRTRVKLNHTETELGFQVLLRQISGVTQAHIHYGLPSENGPVVAFLYGFTPPSGTFNGKLARGTLTEADLINTFAGDFPGFVQALRAGMLYVNVHTDSYPAGEVRGQLGAVR